MPKNFVSSKIVCNFAPQFPNGALVPVTQEVAGSSPVRTASGERRRAKMCFGTIRSFFVYIGLRFSYLSNN